MKYMGGKSRYSKHLVKIMSKYHDNTKPYVEPFVGGGSVIQAFPSQLRYGYDINKYTIAAMIAIRDGYKFPVFISEKHWEMIKYNKEYFPNWYVGIVGFTCSFGGRFFEGYAREAGRTNFIERASRAADKQRPLIQGVTFETSSYKDIKIIDGSTVYCDPPYKGTKTYGNDFCSEEFWEWASELSYRCKVYVSEYQAPDNWTCIWKSSPIKAKIRNYDKLDDSKPVEKLWVLI